MASLTRTTLLKQSRFLSPTRLVSFPTRASSSSVVSRTRQGQAPWAAAFSTSAQRKILPPGPQVIQGGVNDPAPVPKPHPTHGSYHWTAERAISLALIPLTIAPFAGGALNPTLDAVLVGSLLIHSHIGFQAVITDYLPTWKVPGVRKLFDWGLILATTLVGIGFYEFETNDIGLTEAIKMVWRAGENDATVGKASIDGLGHDGKLRHLTK